MNCTEFQKLLSEYENLNKDEKCRLIGHSEECESCAKELAEYISMTEALKSLPKIVVSDDFLSKLNDRIDNEVVKPRKKPIWINLKQHSYRYGAVAACLALVAVIGIGNSDLVNKMMKSDNGDTVNTHQISSSQAPSEAPPKTESPIQTQKPAATEKAKSQQETEMAVPTQKPTSAPKATKKPTATAIPQRTKPTISPVVTNEPVATTVVAVLDDEPVSTPVSESQSTPQSVPTQSPEDAYSIANNDGIAVASIDETETTPVPRMLDPNEYELPDEDKSSEYTVSPANQIEVSYAGADRAKEIINEYSAGSNGDYFSVNANKMEEFLQAMSDAGVYFDENNIETGSDTVVFRLVIS